MKNLQSIVLCLAAIVSSGSAVSAQNEGAFAGEGIVLSSSNPNIVTGSSLGPCTAVEGLDGATASCSICGVVFVDGLNGATVFVFAGIVQLTLDGQSLAFEIKPTPVH